MKSRMKGTLAAILVPALGLTALTADASHFRGGAMVPTIENGTLTVVQTTFWRKGVAESNTPSVSGVGSMSLGSSMTDTSDSRYDRRVNTYTVSVTGAAHGLLNISAGSCCRVATGSSLGNWSQSSWNLNSGIDWNGTDNDPINFSFGTIQPEVSRLPGNDYSQPLNATSPEGMTLSYNQDLNLNINSQVPGFNVNGNTGLMTITGDANRAQITDNSAFNAGADAAFSGNILALADDSFVEFDWMFDGVDASINQAPMVDDVVINALVGAGPVNHTFTASDPEDGSLLSPPGSWDPNLVLGAGFIHATPSFDPNTQSLSWNTTNYSPGQYLIQARAFDSQGVGDFGTLTVNLSAQPTASVPNPGTLLLLGLGLIGLAWRGASYRRK